MRHGNSSRRQRGRNNGGRRNSGGAPKRSQVYDSNGPDVRIRGTAHQVCEKYLALAKDSSAAGDIVLAESYMQHAEHYQRIINSWNEERKGKEQAERTDNKSGANTRESEENQKDDLSLPSSILGKEAKGKNAKDVQAKSSELSEA